MQKVEPDQQTNLKKTTTDYNDDLIEMGKDILFCYTGTGNAWETYSCFV